MLVTYQSIDLLTYWPIDLFILYPFYFFLQFLMTESSIHLSRTASLQQQIHSCSHWQSTRGLQEVELVKEAILEVSQIMNKEVSILLRLLDRQEVCGVGRGGEREVCMCVYVIVYVCVWRNSFIFLTISLSEWMLFIPCLHSHSNIVGHFEVWICPQLVEWKGLHHFRSWSSSSEY